MIEKNSPLVFFLTLFLLQALLDELSAPIYNISNLHLQAFHNISSSVAAVTKATNNLSKSVMLTEKLAQQLKDNGSNEEIQLFSLLALGEIGRVCPIVFDQMPDFK